MNTTGAWKLLQPQVVVMVTSQNEDGTWHCKPFTWAVPVNKTNAIAVMMKHESKTKDNLLMKDSLGRFCSMATLQSRHEVAQAVLMSCAPDPIPYPTERKPAFDVPIACNAHSMLQCECLGATDLLTNLYQGRRPDEGETHSLLLFKVLLMLTPATGVIRKPLMHSELKQFSEPEFFSVKGYELKIS